MQIFKNYFIKLFIKVLKTKYVLIGKVIFRKREWLLLLRINVICNGPERLINN